MKNNFVGARPGRCESGLLSRQSSQGGEHESIVEGVDHAQFGEAIKKGAFCLDDGGVGGTAGLLQVSEVCANRNEQAPIFCDHWTLRESPPLCLRGNNNLAHKIVGCKEAVDGEHSDTRRLCERPHVSCSLPQRTPEDYYGIVRAGAEAPGTLSARLCRERFPRRGLFAETEK